MLPVTDALVGGRARPLPVCDWPRAALALGSETGCAGPAVDGVAATLRSSSPPPPSGNSTSGASVRRGDLAAPVAFCALATATDPRTATFLFRTPAGLVLLASGLGLDALGALWMNRITRTQL